MGVLSSTENATVEKEKTKINRKEDSSCKSITDNGKKVAKLGVGGDSTNDAPRSTRCQSIKNVYSLRSSLEREASDNSEDKSKNDAKLPRRRSLRSGNDANTDLHTSIRTTNTLDRSYVTNAKMNG